MIFFSAPELIYCLTIYYFIVYCIVINLGGVEAWVSNDCIHMCIVGGGGGGGGYHDIHLWNTVLTTHVASPT